MGGKDGDRNKNNPWPSPNGPQQEKADVKLWGVFLFGLIGATATTFAVGQLRKTVDWVYSQFSKLDPMFEFDSYSNGWIEYFVSLARPQSSWKGASGSSFRSSFQEEAWKRYNRRMREEYEEEMERVERIRRMQSVFNRERNKYKKSYESWRQNDYDNGTYHHHFQRDDWYWKADPSYRQQRTNFRQPPRESGSYSLSHHYSVLGLDRFRKAPYTEAEIKTAFRAKAKEFHPDQNQGNKEAAEAKFKEVMVSYEAIKQERKDMNS
ncbi:J domain-containing protein [Citrus sinensis]|uniref:J domain-containing protein n=1 Tax=Citrus sinensis TaxID=2711 RepID=A0ACB8KN94_CITSI|nr:J domain-containing protein [Citrus sinensis]